MRRIGPEELRARALACLEEVAEACRARPADRPLWLRFVLAYLYAASRGGERWPFDWFWASVAEPNDLVRGQNVNASLNAIARAVGVERRGSGG